MPSQRITFVPLMSGNLVRKCKTNGLVYSRCLANTNDLATSLKSGKVADGLAMATWAVLAMCNFLTTVNCCFRLLLHRPHIQCHIPFPAKLFGNSVIILTKLAGNMPSLSPIFPISHSSLTHSVVTMVSPWEKLSSPEPSPVNSNNASHFPVTWRSTKGEPWDY